MTRLPKLALALIFWLAFAAAAAAETRVALVIGNATYTEVKPLSNPVNDATDLALALEDIGFTVTRATDLDSAAMRATLKAFRNTAEGSDMALIFYAGHGIEIENQNYLIPVDADLKSDSDVLFDTIPLDLLTEAVSGAKTLSMVLLDACRDNPFAARLQGSSATRSIGLGLSPVEPAAGTLVAFAARGGTTALDGTGRNSPFTKALLAHIREPGLDISLLFRKVRDTVLADTANRQEPFTYGSLPGRAIYLVPPVRVATISEPDAVVTGSEPEEFVWSLVKDTTEIEKLEGFIASFPDGVHFDEAIARMKELLPDVESGVTIATRPPVILQPIEPPPVTLTPLPVPQTPPVNEAALPPAADSRKLLDACAAHAAWTYETGFEAVGREGHEIDPPAAVAACRAAVTAVPDSIEAKAWLARALVRNDREPEALPLLEAAAAAGSIPATFLLGSVLQDGDPQDLARSAELLGRAAEAGFPPAFVSYGVALERGFGVKPDPEAALAYYQRADAAGITDGTTNIGILYLNGEGVEKDAAEAVKWFRKAADAGNSRALFALGESYRIGNGVPQDYTEAADFFERGAEGGDLRSMRMLGYLYAEGLGVKKDNAKAFEYMFAAADGGDATSMGSLVHFYLQGIGTKRDVAEALHWAEEGTKRGNRSAQANLAAMYESGQGVEKDIKKARELYALAAAQGLSQAKDALERLGFDPEIVTAIQEELGRADCDIGTPDGDWGPRSKAALAVFGAKAGIDLAQSVPSEALLVFLRSKPEVTCAP